MGLPNGLASNHIMQDFGYSKQEFDPDILAVFRLANSFKSPENLIHQKLRPTLATSIPLFL